MAVPYLIQLLESGQEKIHELKFGVNKIGRQLDNHIVINHSLISRHHAEIVVNEDRAVIRDLKSRNHTYVNQKIISEFVLQEGDRVTLGNKLFSYTTVTPTKSVPIVPETRQPSILKQFNLQQDTPLLDKISHPQATERSIIKVNSENNHDRAVEKLKLLLEVSQTLCSPQEPNQMLSTIMELLFKIMDIDRGVILLVNEVTQELECKIIKLADDIEKTDSIYSSNIVDLVWETGDSLLAVDVLSDDRFNNADSVIHSNIHASICVPLKANNNLIGVLYVDNLSMSSVYADEDVEFLTGLATISATAIQMATIYNQREQHLRQKIEELEIQIDPNRRQSETRQALEGLDLERFKTIKRNFQIDD
ncbi:MAG: hypothetical protein Tsb0014_26160 [Pleurocapsa sp.]